MTHARLLLGAAALALAAAAGCGPEPRKPEGPALEVLQAQDEAANAIVASAKSYLDAREKQPAMKVRAQREIGAQDLALETLMEAASALDVSARAERLAASVEADPGRTARLTGTAAALRRAAERTAESARAVIRSGGKMPDEEERLRTDALFLRALARALKVELRALSRETEHD